MAGGGGGGGTSPFYHSCTICDDLNLEFVTEILLKVTLGKE